MNPYVPPPLFTAPPGKRRGLLLTIFVVLSFVANAIGVVAVMVVASRFSKLRAQSIDPEMSALFASLIKLMLILGAAAFAKVVCLIGIWTWKRWGLYGYFGLAVLSLLLSLRAGSRVALVFDLLIVAGLAVTVFGKHRDFD